MDTALAHLWLCSVNNTWQNHHHCALCRLKSQLHCLVLCLLRGRFPTPSLLSRCFLLLVIFLTRYTMILLPRQPVTSVSLWFETEKNVPSYKLKTRPGPLMLGKRSCQKACPEHGCSPPTRPLPQGDRRNVARPPAPGHIPFCLGLKYQMLIIKLLSGDVLAPPMPLKRPFQPGPGVWAEGGGRQLARWWTGPARSSCLCSWLFLLGSESRAQGKVLHRAGPCLLRGKM